MHQVSPRMLSGVLLLRPRGKGDPTLSIQSEPPRLFQPEHSCLCQVRDKELLSNCGPIGVPCARGLPIDLSPRHKQLRMESVKSRPIVRRRKLEYVDVGNARGLGRIHRVGASRLSELSGQLTIFENVSRAEGISGSGRDRAASYHNIPFCI